MQRRKPDLTLNQKVLAKLEAEAAKRIISRIKGSNPRQLGFALASLLQQFTEALVERHGKLIYTEQDLDSLEAGMNACYEVFERACLVDYVTHRDVLSLLLTWLDAKCRPEEDIIDNDMLQ